MKKLIVTTVLAIFTTTVIAQPKPHKIVFDLNSKDTAVHTTLLRQLGNVLKAAPDAELEVVFHGQAVYMMVKSKVFFEDWINEVKSKGKVSYKVCANAMKRLNVLPEDLIPAAEIVPVAILELSEKQASGWSYIKSGQ